MGLETDLWFPGLEAASYRLHLQGYSSSEAVVVQLHIQRRYPWNVFVDGVLVPETPLTITPTGAQATVPTVRACVRACERARV